MAAIERTAYPSLTRHLSPHELHQRYTPSPVDRAFAEETARGAAPTLTVLVLLKTFQHLGYFPRLADVPLAILQHLRAALGLPPDLAPEVTPRTLYRYHQVIRAHLQVSACDRQARHHATRAIVQAAQVQDNPADLTNVAIEELVRLRCELPAFSTLDRLAGRVRPWSIASTSSRWRRASLPTISPASTRCWTPSLPRRTPPTTRSSSSPAARPPESQAPGDTT